MVRLIGAAAAAAMLMLAGPASAQEPDGGQVWILSTEGDDAYLVYGTPESDDAMAVFSCDKGSGAMRLVFPITTRLAEKLDANGGWIDANDRPAPWSAEIGLESGEAAQSFDGRLEPDELNGGSMAVAEFPLAEIFPGLLRPLQETGVVHLVAFAEGGPVNVYEKVTPPPMRPADFIALVSVCSKGGG